MRDDLNEARLAEKLKTRWLGRAYEWHDACASTNDLAAARAKAGAAQGLVVATDTQSAGRGRLGRAWHSPAGESLYVSLLLRPTRPAAEIPPLTLLAGAAVARALAGLGFEPRLKWPNDVQLGDGDGVRKVAGILTEMSSEGPRASHVVVGIGLNVNTPAFPDDLAARATSLRLVGGRALDRADVLAALLGAFEPLYERFLADGPAAASVAWQEFAALGARCRVAQPGGTDATLEGIALGVDTDGALRLRDDAGRIHRVLSGEITT
ncbi:MAG: biotin/acetyl-CoA-carboxylase ligase [Myxococcales bacterium]|nr:biotin/acetyl-CoA-carboxylase ligase [Myxococcales bacterium]